MIDMNQSSLIRLRSIALRSGGKTIAIAVGVGATIFGILALLSWAISQDLGTLINTALAITGAASWVLALAAVWCFLMAANLPKACSPLATMRSRLEDRATSLVVAGYFGSYIYLAGHYAGHEYAGLQYALPQQFLMFSIFIGNIAVGAWMIICGLWKMLNGGHL